MIIKYIIVHSCDFDKNRLGSDHTQPDLYFYGIHSSKSIQLTSTIVFFF